ncbi:MAG: hypothetical protein GX440_05610 [Propionibacterium sp.]|nr:hypothetical protein [Propionibacterium sp.]
MIDADCSELHQMVDSQPEGLLHDQVTLLLADLRSPLTPEVADHPWPPAFFGIGIGVGIGVGKDGSIDLSERLDEVLAEGFRAPRS